MKQFDHITCLGEVATALYDLVALEYMPKSMADRIYIEIKRAPQLTPHPYVSQGVAGWRTCAFCGVGANAGVHRAKRTT